MSEKSTAVRALKRQLLKQDEQIAALSREIVRANQEKENASKASHDANNAAAKAQREAAGHGNALLGCLATMCARSSTGDIFFTMEELDSGFKEGSRVLADETGANDQGLPQGVRFYLKPAEVLKAIPVEVPPPVDEPKPCPENRCELTADHDGTHAGRFKPEELEKVEEPKESFSEYQEKLERSMDGIPKEEDEPASVPRILPAEEESNVVQFVAPAECCEHAADEHGEADPANGSRRPCEMAGCPCKDLKKPATVTV